MLSIVHIAFSGGKGRFNRFMAGQSTLYLLSANTSHIATRICTHLLHLKRVTLRCVLLKQCGKPRGLVVPKYSLVCKRGVVGEGLVSLLIFILSLSLSLSLTHTHTHTYIIVCDLIASFNIDDCHAEFIIRLSRPSPSAVWSVGMVGVLVTITQLNETT